MHTIDACMRLFDWLESRSTRLTKNMVPSKGKALILLRQLNSLVRRVSKTGDTAQFNGRILNFLSGAFPLGERSGVNLRGDYAPQWDESVVKGPEGYVPPEERARRKVEAAEARAKARAEAEAEAKNAAETAEVEALASDDATPPASASTSTSTTGTGADADADAMEGVESVTETEPAPTLLPLHQPQPYGAPVSTKPIFRSLRDPLMVFNAPPPGVIFAPLTDVNLPASSVPASSDRTPEDDRVEFYHAFWALQTPLSNPSILQSSPAHPHPNEAFRAFRANAPKVLAVLKEATKRDRASTLSRASQLEKEKEREREKTGAGALNGRQLGAATQSPSGPSEDSPYGPGRGTKRKISPAEEKVIRETNIRATAAFVVARDNTPVHGKKDYFFAKYLSNLDLMDLEVRILSLFFWPYVGFRFPLLTLPTYPPPRSYM